MIRKILNPTDFSQTSKISFNRAAYFATRLNAGLEVFHVLRPYEFGDSHSSEQKALLDQLHHHQIEHARNKMNTLASSFRSVRNDIQFQFARGLSVGNEIVVEAEKKDIDLIVMGKHGDDTVRRLFLGSAAEYVVRYASCPVLVLGNSQIVTDQPFSNILLATDFSTPSREAAKLAISMAKLEKGSVQMLHVIDDIHSIPAHTNRQLVSTMTDFAGKYQQAGISVSTRIEKGKPSRTIADFAERGGFSLIVIGTSGIRGLDRYILGSVSARVLRYSNVPVLVTRSKTHAAHG